MVNLKNQIRLKTFWPYLLLLFLVVLRYYHLAPKYKIGQRIRITKRLLVEPVRYEKTQYFKLAGLKIYLPRYPEIVYGDDVIIEGTVADEKLTNVKLVNLRRSDHGILKTRSRIISFYQKTLPEPHASLIAGIVLGSRSSIPSDFWEKLKSTGTAHVVVASGMNVALIANFLVSFLVLLISRRRAVILALVGVWIYALMSGYDAPIIRAAIMASIALLAVVAGRLSIAWRALILSALLMLVFNPLWISDLGFILSFAATASLMAFGGKVKQSLLRVPGFFREGLATSLAAQIGVAPILYYSFGRFNLVSPLINALILWTVPLSMVIGTISAIVSYISIFLGQLILFLVYPLTSWFIWVVEKFG